MNAFYNRMGTIGIREPVREAAQEPVRVVRRALGPVSPAFLDVQVHLVNGKTAHYVQMDASTVRSLMSQVSPHQAFMRRHLTFKTNHSAAAYSTDDIERLDFLTDSPLDWFCYSQAARLKEAPQPGNSCAGDAGTAVRRHTSDTDCEIELCSGKIVKVRAAVSANLNDLRTTSDISSYLSRILYNPTIFGERQGGMFLLNTKNIMRFVTLPPTHQTAPSARAAHRMDYTFAV